MMIPFYPHPSARPQIRPQAVKWYPAGATTHSDAGVKETDLERVIPTLTAMAEVPLS